MLVRTLARKKEIHFVEGVLEAGWCRSAIFPRDRAVCSFGILLPRWEEPSLGTEVEKARSVSRKTQEQKACRQHSGGLDQPFPIANFLCARYCSCGVVDQHEVLPPHSRKLPDVGEVYFKVKELRRQCKAKCAKRY